MKSKAPKNRIGVRVNVGTLHFDYPTATGWFIDGQGVLGIGQPSGRYNEQGVEIADTVSAFKIWDRVGWMPSKA